MVHPEAHASLRCDRIRRDVAGGRAAEAGHLPELDEDAGRRARGDEGRLVAVSVVSAIDDAKPLALEERHVAVEPVLLDVEREMMEPLAAARDELLDEALRPGALDQLELPVADEEVGPRELPIVSGPRRLPHADR